MELDGNGKCSSSRVPFVLQPFSSLLPSLEPRGGEPEMVRFIVIHLPTHARKSNSAFGGGKNTSQFDMRSTILQFDTQGEKS